MDIIGIELFIIGMFFGSFFDCMANRLSKGESIIKPGSHCENCKHKLSWYELIPVLSYLFQGGRCKECKIKLPLEYILVEIVTGLLFFLSYLRYGISYQTLEMIVVSSLVIVTIISDLKYMVILDEILNIKDLRSSNRIDFVGGLRGLEELKRRVDSGEMRMALALFPVSMQQIMDIADSGKIMPPKATWFEPKLRSGLVIHKLS